jgi:hypothetical protein
MGKQYLARVDGKFPTYPPVRTALKLLPFESWYVLAAKIVFAPATAFIQTWVEFCWTAITT